MIRHLRLSIDRLLTWDDRMLTDIFCGSAEELRKKLKEKKDAGEVYIGVQECEGFDPVTGCPGHPSETDEVKP